jgi:hypothetical protein
MKAVKALYAVDVARLMIPLIIVIAETMRPITFQRFLR